MTIEICVKTNTEYDNFGNSNPRDLCYYHFFKSNEWLKLNGKANKSDLLLILEKNSICKASINHVKELIKKL